LSVEFFCIFNNKVVGVCLKIVVSEYDFYSMVFDNYSKLKNCIDEDQKAYFFQDSIEKLIEISRELNNEVFLQNAMMIISCLYHDKNIDNYEDISQDMETLKKKDQVLAKSFILKALE